MQLIELQCGTQPMYHVIIRVIFFQIKVGYFFIHLLWLIETERTCPIKVGPVLSAENSVLTTRGASPSFPAFFSTFLNLKNSLLSIISLSIEIMIRACHCAT
jgi:hypothetical protein